MHQYNFGAPFERIAIDIAGLFPESDKGNRYLLIAMDYFTKWSEAYAIPTQDASRVADALVTTFFRRFGVPMELHSDQGRNFESRLMHEVLKGLRISKTRTIPLHPHSDGMVERYVKTIEEHFRKVDSTHQRDWDEKLHILLLVYRASTHETNGVTPANMVFGRDLRPGVRGSYGQGAVDYSLYRRPCGTTTRYPPLYDQLANSAGFQLGDRVRLYRPTRRGEYRLSYRRAGKAPTSSSPGSTTSYNGFSDIPEQR
jgi:transposase InsO family protein